MREKSSRITFLILSFAFFHLYGCGVWVPAPGVEPPVDGGTGGGTARAVLSASNSTPAQNQSVTLTCRAQNSTSQVTRYDFDPATSLLIDHGGGTASFVVKQTDLGTTLRFTCSATLATGVQLISDSIAITPTGTPTSPPPP